MSLIPPADLHLRSYGRVLAPDRHAFAQLVLPLRGELLLDIEGRCGQLDPLRAAFVDTGAWHSQSGDEPNRSIILDLDLDTVAPAVAGRLRERPFCAISPAARKLVEFMGILADGGALAPGVLRGWVPLLLDTLALDAPRPASRLAALLARIEAEPGLPWTTESMANAAGLSISRLHALFREELGTSPHAWLLEHRLARVREWLAGTELPIAELALRAGFSEQSALTRAMRRATGLTPAAWRRQSRENGSNPP
ncbi:MAG TPA: AraC family transcriptional regulator [Ramlibacter sp.]